MAIDAKPLADLMVLARVMRKRNDIVRAAHDFGVSKNQIYEITGMARTTVDRILAGEPTEDDL